MADNKKKLTIEIEVESDIEAYVIVTSIAFDSKIKRAKLGEHEERFDDDNTPFHFLKDNSKNNKSFRDIRAERGKNI